MKNKMLLLGLMNLLLLPPAAMSQVANIRAEGTHVKIVTSGAVNIVLNDVNYINNASDTHFAGTDGTVKFTGASSGERTVSSSSGFVTAFGNVVLNRANGVSLSAPMTVRSTFSMINGNIKTSASGLLTVGVSPAAPGSVSWISGTVIGPIKRYFSPSASATMASGIFPVGNASHNRYARVNYTSNPGTGGSITAEYKSGACPVGYAGLTAIINGEIITNYHNEGYWSIAPAGGNLNTTPYDLTLRGNHLNTVMNLAALRIIKSSGHLAWNDNPLGDGNHVSPSGFTSDFTIGCSGMIGFSWFNIGSNNINVLPVTLLTFNASCGEAVELNWSTATENNALKFIVEKSRDMNAWSTAGELPAAGNSSHQLDYAFTDQNPYAGIAYYRLVQVDINGDEEIYGPISVSCTGEEGGMVAYPNPSKGNFTVEISNNEMVGNTQILVSDLAGKIISAPLVMLHDGKNQVLFNDMNLAGGTYMISIASQSQYKPVRITIAQ